MSELVPRVDGVVTIDKQDGDWVIDGPTVTIRLPADSRVLANDIFRMVRAAYCLGRNHAFEDIRRLIGVDP